MPRSPAPFERRCFEAESQSVPDKRPRKCFLSTDRRRSALRLQPLLARRFKRRRPFLTDSSECRGVTGAAAPPGGDRDTLTEVLPQRRLAVAPYGRGGQGHRMKNKLPTVVLPRQVLA